MLGTVVVSAPERRTRPGRASLMAPSRTTSTPLTSTWLMPSASAYRRHPSPGRSARLSTGRDAMRSGSKTTTSAHEPSTIRPRSRSPYRRAGASVSSAMASSHPRQPEIGDRAAQHHRGVVERGEEVEVRTCVGRSKDRSVVAPHVDPGLPVAVPSRRTAGTRTRYAGRRPPRSRTARRTDRAHARPRCRRPCGPSNALVAGVWHSVTTY